MTALTQVDHAFGVGHRDPAQRPHTGRLLRDFGFRLSRPRGKSTRGIALRPFRHSACAL